MSGRFDLLENPGACRIIVTLSGGEMTTKQIADALGVKPPSVSEQLRKLREAGYVERGEKVGKHQKYVLKKKVISNKFIQNSTLSKEFSAFRSSREKINVLNDFPAEFPWLWGADPGVLRKIRSLYMLIAGWWSYIWDFLETTREPPDWREVRDLAVEVVRGESVDEERFEYDLDMIKLGEKVREDLENSERFHDLMTNFIVYFIPTGILTGELSRYRFSDIVRGFEFGLYRMRSIFGDFKIAKAEDWQRSLVMSLLTWIYIMKLGTPHRRGLETALAWTGFKIEVWPILSPDYFAGGPDWVKEALKERQRLDKRV